MSFEGNMPVCCGPPNEIFDKFGHLYGPSSLGSYYWRFKPVRRILRPGGRYRDARPVLRRSDGDRPVERGLPDPLLPEISGIAFTDPLVKGTPYKLITGLEPANESFALDGTGEYLYAGEGSGIVRIYHRQPPTPPGVLRPVAVEGIRTSRADLHAELASNGADTTYYFEYGTDTNYGSVTPSGVTPRSFHPKIVDGTIEGLEPDTVYHLRVVATNSAGPTYGADRVIKTYPISDGGADDQCVNALARKQTSAQRLPDCRAYELVSANDTAGYDVESYLVPGQEPFPGFPAARDRLLYATHAGAIPGPGTRPTRAAIPIWPAARTMAGSPTTRACPPTSTPLPAPSPPNWAKPIPPSTPSPSPAPISAAPASKAASTTGSAGSPAERPGRPGHGRLARARAATPPDRKARSQSTSQPMAGT